MNCFRRQSQSWISIPTCLVVWLTFAASSFSVEAFVPQTTNFKSLASQASLASGSSPSRIRNRFQERSRSLPSERFPSHSFVTRLLNDATNGEATNGIDYSKMKPQLYNQRWVQLAYLSLLALFSDWICFSVASAPETFRSAYVVHSAASLIDIFLFTNVASCFLVTDTVCRFGLRKSIKGDAALMATGCLFRSGFGPLTTALGMSSGNDGGLVPYWSILVGTILVGAAQPFFQCTPPMLSATWFASNERAKSTAIALNFNQIGIATAFLVGGEMATSAEGLSNYFGLISIGCALVTVGTFMQFENKPATPPSRYVVLA